VLYAPFVKQVDKLDKDVAEMSLSDFVPKRFALNYDPPMISKFPTSNMRYRTQAQAPSTDTQIGYAPIHVFATTISFFFFFIKTVISLN